MSQDQKPARMRLVGSGRTPAAAASDTVRNTAAAGASAGALDPDEAGVGGAGAEIAGAGPNPASAAAADGARGVLLPALLFLGTAAIGGGAVAWLGLAQ